MWYEANLAGPVGALIVRGVLEGTITGVCVASLDHFKPADEGRRVTRVERFHLSVMVSTFSCFNGSSIQLHRHHRDVLMPRKQALYREIWEAAAHTYERVRRVLMRQEPGVIVFQEQAS